MSDLIFIDGNWKADTFKGVLVGIGLIALNMVGLFSLALPPVAAVLATNVGRFLMIVVALPILEEFIFRGMFARKYMWQQVIGFALFHTAVYTGIFIEEFQLSGFFAVSGAFIAALLFGLLAGYLARKTNSLATPIASHMVINLWLVLPALAVI